MKSRRKSVTQPVALVAATLAGLMSSGVAFADDTSRLTIGGYIKLDALFSEFSDGPVAGDLGRDFYLPALIPVSTGDGESASYLDMHAKETRLYLKADTEVEGRKLGAYVEFDFLVNPGSGDERVTNAYNPGLRRAYISFENWTFGQDWSTFQNGVALPESLDFIGYPSGGTPFIRQPLVRYTLGGFDVSVENPETTITQADGTRVTADQNTTPDLGKL